MRLYSQGAARIQAVTERASQVEEALLAVLERWEQLEAVTKG